MDVDPDFYAQFEKLVSPDGAVDRVAVVELGCTWLRSMRERGWIARIQSDAGATAVYEIAGKYFLVRSESAFEELTELELRHLVLEVVERQKVQGAVDTVLAMLPNSGASVTAAGRRKVVEDAHRRGRETGLLQTGSVDLRRFLGGDND
jgi:hypothetical protein